MSTQLTLDQTNNNTETNPETADEHNKRTKVTDIDLSERRLLTTAVYCRGSTTGALQEDIETVLRYAANELGHEWLNESAITRVQTALPDHPRNRLIATPEEGRNAILITGDIATDAELDDPPIGLVEIYDEVTKRSIETVVVSAADRMVFSADAAYPRSIASEYGADIHLVEQGLIIRRNTSAVRMLLRALTDVSSSRDKTDPPQSLDYEGGRPPLGFTAQDGRLVPTSNYAAICDVLADVAADEMTVTAAANELDISRNTVRKAVRENPERYGLTERMQRYSH